MHAVPKGHLYIRTDDLVDSLVMDMDALDRSCGVAKVHAHKGLYCGGFGESCLVDSHRLQVGSLDHSKAQLHTLTCVCARKLPMMMAMSNQVTWLLLKRVLQIEEARLVAVAAFRPQSVAQIQHQEAPRLGIQILEGD